MRPTAVDVVPKPATETYSQQSASRFTSLLRRGLLTSHMPPVRLGRRDWVYIVSLFLCSRLLVFFIGLLGANMLPAFGPQHAVALQPIVGNFWDIWPRLYDHFDSGWYLGISHAYLLPSSGVPDWLMEWGFFPLYPWLLHPVSLLLVWLHVPSQADVVAAVIVSHLGLFAAMTYLYRLTVGELSAAVARRTISYLLIFPASFFLSAVYPDGVFLFFSVAAFYHTRRRQWAWAGMFTALSLLTRPQGLFLLVPLGLEFAAARRAEGRPFIHPRLLRGLWLVLPPLLALGGYALYSHALTGYWLAFEVSETKAWGHRLTPFLYPFVRYLLAPELGGAYGDFTFVHIVVTTIFVILAIVAWRRLPPAYTVWILLNLLIPLSSQGHRFTSMTRYCATIFPAFIALAAWTLNQRWTPTGARAARAEGSDEVTGELRDRLVVIPSLLTLAVYIIAFVNGAPAAT